MDRKNALRSEGRDQGSGFLRIYGQEVAKALRELPPLRGLPLRVEWAAGLRNVRGSLRFGGDRGLEVHAASFIRERRMVLDTALRRDPAELSRVLVHELFHFAWVRLSNSTRRSWRDVLTDELALRSRGELGWSAESRKKALRPRAAADDCRAWREYCCESFCDTAAWLYTLGAAHEEFTLAQRYRNIRRAWFRAMESHRAGEIRI